jgi:hypothetical protein
MQYPSGNWYEGEWMNGKRHGKGLMVWADRGEQYQGEWKVSKIVVLIVVIFISV